MIEEFCTKYPHTIEAFGALAPAFIAMMMFFVAFKQWETAEKKRRQDLFELRKKYLYQNTCERNFLSTINEKISEKINDIEFNKAIDEYTQTLRTRKIKAEEYEYLIKKSDYEKLFRLYNQAENNIQKLKSTSIIEQAFIMPKLFKVQMDINDVFESYLRIEQEKTIFEILFNMLKKLIKFLNPRNFIIYITNMARYVFILISEKIYIKIKKAQKPTEEVE